uniref:Dynein heavy chain tail domain-containing protein n=1 Tax=Xiphophorus maculatus TaxID=8083 RepID=A0A3B5PR00_XIPMA
LWDSAPSRTGGGETGPLQPTSPQFANCTSCLVQVYKKEREERRNLLTSSHKYMFEIIACELSLTPSAVEEFVLDSPSLAAFDNFFAAGGCKTISFVYQESDPPGVECGRTHQGLAALEKGRRLFLADLSKTCLTGICCYFDRTDVNDPQICFSVIDATEGLLKGLRNAYGFLLPILEAQDSWGALDQSKHGEKTKKIYIYIYIYTYYFLSVLPDLHIRNTSVVHLSKPSGVNFSKLTCLEEMKAAASDFEEVQRLEEILRRWCKEIEQVLTEDDQLRKIDAEGPLSELEYWKKKHSKFSSIVNHMKSEECNAVVMVLHIRRSKMIKVWRDLDKRITDRVNESKDYLKFLSTLEKVLQALYNNDPDSLIKSVHSLVNAVELVHRVPLFRNINEKMPSLLIKVTNQLVTACRAHITDHGKSLIWDQDSEQLMRKMQVTVIKMAESQIKCCSHMK